MPQRWFGVPASAGKTFAIHENGDFGTARHLRTIFRLKPELRTITRCVLALALFSASPALAEKYLSVPEAQKLCFPKADRFEPQTIRFTADEIKAIQKRASGKVTNRGNRIVEAYSGTNLLGVLVVDHVLGKHEIIDYAVAINAAGQVLQVELLEYRESHGYEIRSEKWREQFKGKTADSRLKLHDDIYNISGATISCRHVTEGIQRVLATYETVLRPRLSAAGRLPKPAPGS